MLLPDRVADPAVLRTMIDHTIPGKDINNLSAGRRVAF
jgi:hypothetical protein